MVGFVGPLVAIWLAGNLDRGQPTRVHEVAHRPVDRRDADTPADVLAFLQDLSRSKGILGGIEHLNNGLALGGLSLHGLCFSRVIDNSLSLRRGPAGHQVSPLARLRSAQPNHRPHGGKQTMRETHSGRTPFRLIPMVGMLIALSGVLMTSCGRAPDEAVGEVHFVATIQPVYLIARELTEGRATMSRLLDPGASPHTYDPRPSDVRSAERATALLHVSADIDGWAAGLPSREKVALLPLIPPALRIHFDGDGHVCPHDHGHDHGHGHADEDGHFWTDPVVIGALLGPLAEELGRLDPEGREHYLANAQRMEARLSELHEELATLLGPIKGSRCILFHPSFNYMFERYGIEVSAVLEPSPGQEASPAWLRDIIRKVEPEAVKAIFTEPQLSRRPAEVLAEASGLPLFEIDPIGVHEDLAVIDDLLLHNARVLREALE